MTNGRERDRLILDRDLPQQESRIGLGTTPVDVDEASTFTLKAELVRLSGIIREKAASKTDRRQTESEIERRMKQAEEDRDKLSERGIVAFKYLQSTKPKRDGWGLRSARDSSHRWVEPFLANRQSTRRPI
jgi:hypothetical protein